MCKPSISIQAFLIDNNKRSLQKQAASEGNRTTQSAWVKRDQFQLLVHRTHEQHHRGPSSHAGAQCASRRPKTAKCGTCCPGSLRLQWARLPPKSSRKKLQTRDSWRGQCRLACMHVGMRARGRATIFTLITKDDSSTTQHNTAQRNIIAQHSKQPSSASAIVSLTFNAGTGPIGTRALLDRATTITGTAKRVAPATFKARKRTLCLHEATCNKQIAHRSSHSRPCLLPAMRTNQAIVLLENMLLYIMAGAVHVSPLPPLDPGLARVGKYEELYGVGPGVYISRITKYIHSPVLKRNLIYTHQYQQYKPYFI